MPPRRLAFCLLLLAAPAPAATAADPTDNPVASFYSGPEGYPAWTDKVNWSRVINMKTWKKGKTAYEKFSTARDALAETGGVLYYPAGVYDFTTLPPGRGLMLRGGVVIRGEAPAGRPLAAGGKLELPTRFVFRFRKRGGGMVPDDWNVIGLQTEYKKQLKDVDNVGVAWVHLVGATVYFGPQLEWGRSWASADSFHGNKVKKAWGKRQADGTHPGDPLTGAGKKYVGAGKGRFVFGCVLEDSAVLDDFLDPGYGPDGFHTYRHGARIAAYGARVLVANNLLPRGTRNFKYKQKTRPHPANKGGPNVLFDYGKTMGIDVNKELLAWARAEGKCRGYFEEGVVVRDNSVFNHGHKGYNLSGKWVTVANNRNTRAFLRQGDDVYGLRPGYALTLDGWQCSGGDSDNLSRAFDLAGRNLWIDGNRFDSTGSFPGNDGEGILGRAHAGTPITSWAITHNTHSRGAGLPGALGGWDSDCRGLLIAWNETAGWVGNAVTRKGTTMSDCSFVANKCKYVLPDAKDVARFGVQAPLTANPAGAPKPPTRVTATHYADDAVKVSWRDASDNEVGFRVERRVAGGKWQVIAYRPPRIQGDEDNAQAWVDFTAPAGKELTYRVVAVNAGDDDKGASEPTDPITMARPRAGNTAGYP
jgi:hypothetical protein